jgi:myo-inositol-1(or 4)-monophosphatase
MAGVFGNPPLGRETAFPCGMIRAMSENHLPPRVDREAFKATAIEAASTAGAMLLDLARKGFRVHHKDTVNLVTDADRRAEEAIVERLIKAYPTHQILAEEKGVHRHSESPFKWIIDPLDGTTNFAHGYPAYCVSIGLEYKGAPILGVILDPTRGELFVGAVGDGATLNGIPIHVSRAASLNQALLVTGFAYDIRETPQNNLDHFARFALQAQGMRRTGSAALDLCYVATGRFDGFWELKLHPWDMAAGTLIVYEAGGRVTDFKGGAHSIYGKELVATNGLIHEEVLTVLNQERR